MLQGRSSSSSIRGDACFLQPIFCFCLPIRAAPARETARFALRGPLLPRLARGLVKSGVKKQKIGRQ